MNNTPILASGPHEAAWPGTSAGRADVSLRHFGLATLRSILETWEERRRLRWQLERMSKANPHLIADIGLTRRQVETEIAKPFWRA